MKTNAFRKIIGTFAVLALALGAGVAIRSVSAGTETGSGWLWGGGVTPDVVGYQGAGWISLNDTNAGSGGGTYGVNIPGADGALSGYGWSEHYGWVSFNGADLAGCAPALAQATRTGNAITGGARIIAIKDAVAVNNAGGFDGCISLSGANYGVTVAGASLAGYAWSSDLGWFDFSQATYASPSVLKLCLVSGGSNIYLDKATTTGTTLPGRTLSSIGSTETFKVWSGTDNEICDGSDVTSITAFSDQGGNNTIDITGTGTPTITVTAKTIGNETVSVPNASASPRISIPYIVPAPSCTSNCSAQASNHCSGEAFTTTNSCGTSEACTGTRYCDFNWKEVAPGQ